MAFEGMYNVKSRAVKRLMREAQELREATDEYYAYPLDDNLFEWHFTVRGPQSTDFDGGIYHGKILLPPEYPMKPPNIILLTPNGRFELKKNICLSISGHHPETWQPSWSIRTALLALIAFMPTPGNGTIGSLDYSTAERQKLAKKSLNWYCDTCGRISYLLLKDKTKVFTEEQQNTLDTVSLKANEATSQEKTLASNADNIEENELRHRNNINNEDTVHEPELIVNPQVEVVSSFNDILYNFIIAILIFAILLLLLRRISLVS